jgi:hypothetical protein
MSAKRSSAGRSPGRAAASRRSEAGAASTRKASPQPASESRPRRGGGRASSTTEAAAGATAGPKLLLVNMIPRSLSDETNQDSEPTLAVNPLNPDHIVGTAFTPDPTGGDVAPYFLSVDGGRTWTLNSVIPSQTQTMDICVGFSPSGKLYAGILHNPPPANENTQLNILRTANYQGAKLMTVLVDRVGVDQPYVQAAPTGKKGKDCIYVGDNDFGGAGGNTSTIDYSLNAAVSKAKFKKAHLEVRPNVGQNGPQVRPACHADGTVYLAYMGWRAETGDWVANTLVVTADLVVVRDDRGGNGKSPFTALVDPGDGLAGVRVAQGISFPFNHDEKGVPGQQRLGGDVAIAVDPTDSGMVYVSYAALDPTTGYTVHLRRSTDRGRTWSGDLHTLPKATNPSLAVNSDGKVGILYQQLMGTGALHWVTKFDRSADRGVNWSSLVLADTPADVPVADFSPYLGDYDCVLAVGKDFYGIFSANNSPDVTHFPNGVLYQRNTDFTSRRLLGTDNATTVKVSIDPFFFKLTE